MCVIAVLAITDFRAVAAFPVVRNFSKFQYKGGPQNWGIAETSEGNMIVCNSYGLLCFNSMTWSLYQLPNFSTVRCALVDRHTCRVYVGGTDEFGYFINDGKGGISYCSLRHTLSASQRDFAEIWKIHSSGDDIWFQGDFSLYRYDGRFTHSITFDSKITSSTVVDGTPYVALYNGKIYRISGQRASRVPMDNGVFENTQICSLLPYGQNSLLILTNFNGFFLFDGVNVRPFKTMADQYITDNQAFCAVLSGDDLAVGTVKRGAVVINLKNGYTTYINKQTSLQNNTVLSLAFDKNHNLWMGLDSGVSLALLNFPVWMLFGSDSDIGTGYASLLSGNNLFLGTNQGLYSVPFPIEQGAPSDPRMHLPGQVWNLDTIDNTIFAGTDIGLYAGREGSFRKIEGIPGTVSVARLHRNPNILVASTYSGLYTLRKNNGNWTVVGKMKGYKGSPGNLVADIDDNIWFAHWLKGVYRLHLNFALNSVDNVTLFDTTRGFPSNRNNSVALMNNEVVFSTCAGIYHLDSRKDSVVPHNALPKEIASRQMMRFFYAPNQDLWMFSPQEIVLAKHTNYGSLAVDSTKFSYLTDKLIPGYENLSFISPNLSIAGTQEGFYILNSEAGTSPYYSNSVAVARIYANQDSLIYTNPFGTPPTDSLLEIPYKLNSLIIEYVEPEYIQEEAVRYSYYLEGYDDDWSPASLRRRKEYTLLSPGTYTFHVKALNKFSGKESECKFIFCILAPWYLSIWAKCLYAVVCVLLCRVIYKYLAFHLQRKAVKVNEEQQRQLQVQKERAEQDAMRKEFEIQQLQSEKLRDDIKFKSSELSNLTMNVIHKNEILIEISSRLDALSKKIQTSADPQALGRLIKQIKQMIKDNISHDDDWNNFTKNFNLAYNNYLHRLAQQYPNLTISDLRMCACIRMGLNSKEIASLINIAPKSVEMSRYRLRKKLNLDADSSLADFLLQF